MLDLFATSQAGQNMVFLILVVLRNKRQNRPANHLRRGVAESPLGALVPGSNHTGQVFADNRVIGGFDDGGQKGLGPSLVKYILRHPNLLCVSYAIRRSS